MLPFTANRRNWFFPIILVFFWRHASAQQNEATDPYSETDIRLNTTFQRAVGSLPMRDQLALGEAHTAWIKFREATYAALVAQQNAGYFTSEGMKLQTLKEENQHIRLLEAFFFRWANLFSGIS